MANHYYTTFSLLVFSASLLVLYQLRSGVDERTNQKEELEKAVTLLNLQQYRSSIFDHLGCSNVVCLVNSISDPQFKLFDAIYLKKNVLQLKGALILHHWLKKKNLLDIESLLVEQGIQNIEKLYKFHVLHSKSILSSKQIKTWNKVAKTLPESNEQYSELAASIWSEIEEEAKEPWTAVGIFTLSLCVAVFSGMVLTMSQPRLETTVHGNQKLDLISYVIGRYLSPLKSKVIFDWTEPQVVGNTMSFVVKFYQRNGQPYPICNEDNILIEITQGTYKIAHSLQIGGPHIPDANKAQVQFTVRRSGEYRISVLVGSTHIHGSPFIKYFIPGSPDPLKTCFIQHSSTVVGTCDVPTQLVIELRDRYDNLCIIDRDNDPTQEYSVDIIEITTGRPLSDSYYWDCYSLTSRLVLKLKFPRKGCYRAMVSYKGQMIQNGDFHIIILDQEESFVVHKNVAKKNKCYEVKLLALNGERSLKPKKVYCYISPKQLTLKEYMWKFFPKHLVTFRLCPSTKFKFESSRNNLPNDAVLLIDDGCQQEVELMTSERNIIAATFTQFLLKNIGGSETFKDKQDFFHHEVRKFHLKHFHDKMCIKIIRESLLESSIKETKSFSVNDWCKSFELTFVGEEGVDLGGLRREWFELVCTSLFHPEHLLFQSFQSDKQGLVHPCPSHKRPSHLKLKHYEFAGKIVGKCLYESSLGSCYRQLVKAKFTRSFLAQLIGLNVHYKLFEHDDPELYVSKIKYILENDIEDMELHFTEEIYDMNGQLIEEVDLVPNGSNLPVTNTNKIQYLNALAQYRLATSVKSEIEHFLKGLTELIPDNLLCIFDENELELLMCGTGSYSIADFRTNHSLSGASYEFRKVLEWFWIAVSNFSEEEMARLLQFTTGCSQLPPGGFAELSPKFHITAAQTFGILPTAHTCFNQLCLPDYESYEQFEKALRLAINEGSEGFGIV